MDLVPALEVELAEPVVREFAGRGYAVLQEVPFNGRIADVIACGRDGEVVAVELKLRAWKTALRQALAYQVACHRTYVALPLAVALPLLGKSGARAAFEEAGCGLLAVNHPYGDVRELVPAGESPRRLPFLTARLSGLAAPTGGREPDENQREQAGAGRGHAGGLSR